MESDNGLEQQAKTSGIETTEEELEGYRIVKAIVCQSIDLSRVAHRDTKSYFGILLDDNNRKPICRLRFNTSQKYIGVFDENKVETKHAIDQLSDIYKFAPGILASVSNYQELN